MAKESPATRAAGQTSTEARPVYGRMFQTPFSDQIRNDAKIATMCVGAITTADQVNTIVASGRADLVALYYVADPYLAELGLVPADEQQAIVQTEYEAYARNALVQLRRWPQPGERCLDLGASPGGWTWVLARLGAEVIAIDKAPLEPRIAAMPGVSWRGESAFALEPESVGPVDWLFSDIICYPARLLRLVERWRASGLVKNFVCTIKFQGETDHDSAEAFAAIPGARVLHLHHNKHELTFLLATP